jgi:3-hydroxybutyryl-CoA dehydrogenase
MKIVVIASPEQKETLLSGTTGSVPECTWSEVPLASETTGCYIDLLFDGNRDRIKQQFEKPDTLVIINDTTNTLIGQPGNIIRINGWPTFINRNSIEAAGGEAEMKEKAIKVLALFNKQIHWCADKTGMISARVICTIINEAYLALEEAVSTKEEIDTAMKLGTNYPYGPFEWCEKIGKQNVAGLLVEMSKENQRYKPCALLINEAAC